MKITAFVFVVIASAFADEYLQSNIHFSSDLYKELVKTKSGNFLVCPLSAQIILSLLSLGAEGNTAKELVTALSLPASSTKIRNMFEKLSSKLEVAEPYQLSSANKIYLAEGFTIRQEYKDLAVNVYKSDIGTINFSDKEKAAKEMNAWIESKTENKIKNLVKKESLSTDTVAVLVNSMYFHGFWLNEFGSYEGYKAPFFISPTKSVNVEVFGGRNDFNYYENKELKSRFLEMPFVGNEVTMTYVLPDEKDGLAQLENRISEVLAEQPYQKYDVIVEFPKVKMETDIDLKAILKSLGVQDAFNLSADFKGITNAKFIINEVLQKTFIEVNERGATAAAASGAFGMIISGPRAYFSVDRPHVFFLKHTTHGVLFVGRYTGPAN